MRLGLKVFFILFTLVCAGFGGWHEYKMYHWRRTIPVNPIHEESVSGFPSEVQVIFDQATIDTVGEAALQNPNGKYLPEGLESKIKSESPAELLAWLSSFPEIKRPASGLKINPTNKTDQTTGALMRARQLILQNDSRGFDWLVSKYSSFNQKDQQAVRSIFFADTPKQWIKQKDVAHQIIRGCLQSDSSLMEALVAARFAERIKAKDVVEDLMALAEANKHNLQSNLRRFGEEPIGELMRIACTLDPSMKLSLIHI